MPQATSLAATIKERLGVEADLIQAGGGKFEIVADGQLIYSKLATGEFPAEDVLIQLLQEPA